MIEYSAGIVTAYGSAVRAGYTGTYEDFCRQQAQYADNALAVEQAKQTAVSSAQTADQAKQDAQTASTTAQQSAQSAQGSAQSAGQSAQDAQTAKNNAQGYAQSASASAGSAQQSAQTAQAVLESIPEDYSDLSEDVDQLKADLDNNFGFYDVLKYELPSVSSVGEYWNNRINVNIPQGSKLHLEFLEYTGEKLVKVRFIAYNVQGTGTTLLDTVVSGRNYVDVVTVEEYTQILIQAQRTSAENGVRASFFVRGDFTPGVGKDYYGLIDKMEERVSKDGIAEVTINNTQFLKTKNIFNPNGIVEGYIWRAGAPETNQNYCYTQRIYNVKPSTTYVVSTNSVSAWQIYYTAWNASGSHIGAGNVGTYSGQTNTFTTPANTEYVIFSALTANKNLIMVEEGTTPTIFEAYGTVAHPTVKIEGIEGVPLVMRVEKDGSGDFDSIVGCINYINNNDIMNAVVYVGDGTWDIIDELGASYIESVSRTKRGIYLQNRTHVICSSKSKIVCNYTGTRNDTITWLSAFNAGQYGFTLENATIESSKCRYAIHDERDYATDSYKNEYINCKITHDNTNGGNIQCIGGGLGTNGYIVIKGCIFSNPNLGEQGEYFNHLVSYHNSWGIGRSFIECAGNYLDGIGTFKFSWFGGSTELTPILCYNNSIGSAVKVAQETNDISVGVPVDIENIDVKQWNNVIRDA